MVRAVFWGLGSDGTVGANKNSIKIIGEETPNSAQGYFVYDSKKSGARTISHLRFGPRPIMSTYLIRKANFVAVHQFGFFQSFDVLETAAPGATLLINAPYPADEVWDQLPRPVQEEIIRKQLKVYTIDAYEVAGELGMGIRINTIMQTCFFAISGVLPQDEAIEQIKHAIEKTYGKRGEIVVRQNFAAVDASVANMHKLDVPAQATSTIEMPPTVPARRRISCKNVTAMMMAGDGDLLPVSAMPVDGTFPSATTQWEKRNIALEVPVWEPDICIQCGKCVLVCPHAVIRAKVVSRRASWRVRRKVSRPRTHAGANIPDKQVHAAGGGGRLHRLHAVCGESARPRTRARWAARPSTWQPHPPLREQGRKDWAFFDQLPEQSPTWIRCSYNNVKNIQLLEPLFEFSGACAGCGETPYLKLMSQLVWRPCADCQRHGLLVHLWRQPADDAMGQEQRRPRPGVEQLAVRGQRRVRHGHAPDAGQAERICAGAGGAAARRDRRRAGRRAAGSRPVGPRRASRSSGHAWRR